MAVAFTYTASRFPPGSSLATVVPETMRPGYRHIGPGCYHAEDPNNPTIAMQAKHGYFPSMAPTKHNGFPAPRIPPLPPGMVTELQQPDMAHLGPGYYKREPDTFEQASIKVGCSDHSVFMHSPRTARIAETRTKEQIMLGEVGVRFDHIAEAKTAWSHGGRLPQSARFSDSREGLSPKELLEKRADRTKQRRALDLKLSGRMENIHKYGVAMNAHDAIEEADFAQMEKSIMLKSTQMQTAHSSVFNSVVEKFSKCPAQLLTENQVPHREHMGPGQYKGAHDHHSIRNRTKGSNPSSSFASSSPRFRKTSRRELTFAKGQAQLVKETEQMQKQKARIARLYDVVPHPPPPRK